MEFFEHGGQAGKGGIDYDFSCNVNPLGLPPGVRQVLKNEWQMNQCYPDPECLALRGVIAREWGKDPAFVVCGNGASELIYAVVRAVMPKTGIVTAPAFSEYERALLSCGVGVAFYPLKRELGFQFQEDFFSFLGQQQERSLLFLCNPNNPTGNLLNRDFLIRVLEYCQKKEIFVVVDECFLPFVTNAATYSLHECFLEFDNLFLLQAFTKLYAMPGLRLGYGICCNRELLTRVKWMMPAWNVSVMAQRSGVAAFLDKEYVVQTRMLIKEELRFMEKGLNELTEMVHRVYPAAANFIFFEGQKRLSDSLRTLGIAIRSCENYRGLQKGDFRVAVKSRAENEALLQGIAKISQYGTDS